MRDESTRDPRPCFHLFYLPPASKLMVSWVIMVCWSRNKTIDIRETIIILVLDILRPKNVKKGKKIEILFSIIYLFVVFTLIRILKEIKVNYPRHFNVCGAQLKNLFAPFGKAKSLQQRYNQERIYIYILGRPSIGLVPMVGHDTPVVITTYVWHTYDYWETAAYSWDPFELTKSC